MPLADEPDLRRPVVHVARPATRSAARFNDYTVEVVQQIGSDSFTGGSGVLLAKTKNQQLDLRLVQLRVWYIDANPQDINQVDYVKADGTPVKATIGDERQVNDGTFHAGTNSGSQYEFKAAGEQPALLHHRQAHRRAGRQRTTRSASARSPAPARRRAACSSARPVRARDEGFATCTFPLTNTGAAATTPNVHPQDASAFLNSDIYRLSASTIGDRAGRRT